MNMKKIILIIGIALGILGTCMCVSSAASVSKGDTFYVYGPVDGGYGPDYHISLDKANMHGVSLIKVDSHTSRGVPYKTYTFKVINPDDFEAGVKYVNNDGDSIKGMSISDETFQ